MAPQLQFGPALLRESGYGTIAPSSDEIMAAVVEEFMANRGIPMTDGVPEVPEMSSWEVLPSEAVAPAPPPMAPQPQAAGPAPWTMRAPPPITGVPQITPRPEDDQMLQDAMRLMGDPRSSVAPMPGSAIAPDAREMEQLTAERLALMEPAARKGGWQTLGESLLGQFSTGNPFAVQNMREAKRQKALDIKTKRYEELKAEEQTRYERSVTAREAAVKAAETKAEIEAEMRSEAFDVRQLESREAIADRGEELERERIDLTRDYNERSLDLEREKFDRLNQTGDFVSTQWGILNRDTGETIQPQYSPIEPDDPLLGGRTLYSIMEDPEGAGQMTSGIVGRGIAGLQQLPFIGASGAVGRGIVAKNHVFAKLVNQMVISALRSNPRNTETERADLEARFSLAPASFDNPRAYMDRVGEVRSHLKWKMRQAEILIRSPDMNATTRAEQRIIVEEMRTALQVIGSPSEPDQGPPTSAVEPQGGQSVAPWREEGLRIAGEVLGDDQPWGWVD
jgi:hypothetical protein